VEGELEDLCDWQGILQQPAPQQQLQWAIAHWGMAAHAAGVHTIVGRAPTRRIVARAKERKWRATACTTRKLRTEFIGVKKISGQRPLESDDQPARKLANAQAEARTRAKLYVIAQEISDRGWSCKRVEEFEVRQKKPGCNPRRDAAR
jgi:hypothetical protein